jgi:hypothetical protein
MSLAYDSKEDRSSALELPKTPNSAWRVAEVEVLEDYRVRVRFRDGTDGVVDLYRLIFSPEAGVFSVLQDPEMFAQARVVLGAVTWPGELDLAPDAMYDEIRAHGEWIVK